MSLIGTILDKLCKDVRLIKFSKLPKFEWDEEKKFFYPDECQRAIEEILSERRGEDDEEEATNNKFNYTEWISDDEITYEKTTDDNNVVISNPDDDEHKIFTIFVEGNIGAGKTTLLKYLEQTQFEEKDVYIHREPSQLWESELEKCCETNRGWFNMEFNIIRIMLNRLYRLQYSSVCKRSQVHVFERSILSVFNVFVPPMLAAGLFSPAEEKIYRRVKNLISKMNLAPSLIIYVNTPLEMCLERIKKRNRPCEKSMTLDYLKTLKDHHETWIREASRAGMDVVRVDVTPDNQDIGPTVSRIVNDLIKEKV